MGESAPPMAAWPDDLEVPGTAYAEVFSSMDADLRIYLGKIAMEMFMRIWSARILISQKILHKLESEISKGLCTLTVSCTGEVERAVSVTTLRLQRSDDRILAQMARIVASKLVAACMLPGTKQEDSEL